MSKDSFTLRGEAGPVLVERNSAGVVQITALEKADALFGLGYCHAQDRGLQMLMMRISGRGEVSEYLVPSRRQLAIDRFFRIKSVSVREHSKKLFADVLSADRFFRRVNFASDNESQEAALSKQARADAAAYCRGVNHYFSSRTIPWELRLLGYSIKGKPWTVADIFLVAKVIGYMTLAQSQYAMEKFILQCVQNGVAREKLEELFPGLLQGLDEDLIRKVQLEEPIIPSSLKWASALPVAMASNNWAVAGNRTVSGKPILANDPHLEVNRLPAVWYEAVLRWRVQGAYRYAMGGTMPGVSGVIEGRTSDLAWGVTYAFMDSVDSWIEQCQEGKYRRGDEWLPFSIRREIIRGKNRPPVECVFYDSPHGVLEGNPWNPGFYLSTRWACLEETGASSLEALSGIMEARSVEEGRNLLGRLSNSAWNWVLADREGNIGYQMSGKMPRRREGISGIIPLPGWDPANDWQGFADPAELPRSINPPEGFIVTANNDLNALGKVHPINLPMGPYRAERVRDVLAKSVQLNVEAMTKLQFDLYSGQAARFMALLQPLLQSMEKKRFQFCSLLSLWNCHYDQESLGAFLFERTYRALLREVFGGGGANSLGIQITDHLGDRTALITDFYGNFDRIMLAETSAWFDGRPREEIYAKALEAALSEKPEPYGKGRRILMKHLLFGGKFPRWFGFDRGPVPLLGNRSTVHQGQIFRVGSRETTFGPSLRFVTDMATDEMHTTLPGGPSDRRFSKWYANEIENWLKGRYKVLHGSGSNHPARRA